MALVSRLSGLYAGLACLWEATARKPGNVHRYRDFDDATYVDFAASAAALQAVFDEAAWRDTLGFSYWGESWGSQGVGQLVHSAIGMTTMVVRPNTNLGIALLLAPLAKVPDTMPLSDGLGEVLNGLDREDARNVYKAIRLANPTGLGRVEHEDISAEPTLPLREVMALAADRDLVARQYANGYREVFDEGVPALVRGLETTGCLEGAIIFCHLSLIAAHPDSLIARKRGTAEAEEASRRARAVLGLGWPHAPAAVEALARLDDWLRGAGRGRNPGTTADLVTACLFVALREQIIKLPIAHPWTLLPPSDMKNATLPPPERP